MGAVWMRLRAEVRARGRSMLGISLLLGVMAGGATAAAVGARRTETAYPRFVERYRAFDVTVTTGGNPDTESIFAEIATLPQVESVERGSLFLGSIRTDRGKEAAFPDVFFLGEDDRPGRIPAKVVRGRASDPSSVSEAMVNYAMAERMQIEPDDHATVTLRSEGENGPVEEPVEIVITGTYASVGEFESSTGGGFPTTFRMTPAFRDRFREFVLPGEDNLGVLLRRGDADADAFRRELELRGIDTDGPPTRAAALTPGVQSLNRVPAVALWLLAAFLGLTTLAVLAQLLARETWTAAADYPALRALGVSPGQLFRLALARALLTIAAGTLFSVGVAFLLSPLTPVGHARIAEPDPGFAFAPLMLLAGGATSLVLVTLSTVPSAWRAARSGVGRARGAQARVSGIAARLGAAGAPPAMASGVRMALEPGHGDRAVPVRTAALGTAIAVAALAAAVTFAGSLARLTGDPRLAGYTWDAGAISASFEPSETPAYLDRMSRAARARIPGARVWRGSVFLAASVDGVEVTAVVSDGPDPSMISGRAPRADDEVALDPRTLRRTGKEMGDRVDVVPLGDEDAPPQRGASMRVVGLFAVPRIAFQGQNPGQGVAMTPAGSQRVDPGGDYGHTLFVLFPTGMDFDDGMSELRAAVGSDAFALVSRQQSATVGNVERISSLPNVLAGTMALLGCATLAHALTTTIRRRRRDLAILKTLGFVGRQVRASVAWQSTTLVVAALLVGLPVGIATGRWGWRLFAEQLQVVPVPAVSAVMVGAVLAGAIAAANLIAALPARAAARTEPAVVLREE